MRAFGVYYGWAGSGWRCGEVEVVVIRLKMFSHISYTSTSFVDEYMYIDVPIYIEMT